MNSTSAKAASAAAFLFVLFGMFTSRGMAQCPPVPQPYADYYTTGILGLVKGHSFTPMRDYADGEDPSGSGRMHHVEMQAIGFTSEPPLAEVDGRAIGAVYDSGGWEAGITYYFAIAPCGGELPAVINSVPIQIRTRAYVSAGGYRATAVAVVETPLSGRLQLRASTIVTPAVDQFDILWSGELATVQSHRIFMSAVGGYSFSGGPNFDGLQSAEFRALADPEITIDPSFPYKDYFEIQYSANLIPEPHSLGLCLAACGAMFAVGRCRQRQLSR